jgi:hypothetical protein
MKKDKITIFILTCFLLTVFYNYSFAISEKEKIRYLLQRIEDSGCIFIRNGKKYTSQKAKKHLEYKLKRADRYIYTAEDFINKIASRSSFTGRPYYIRMKNGMLIKAEQWLREQLKDLEKTSNPGKD